MFSSQIIDVALGLVFIYFFLSIVLSVANEWIANKLNWRPKMLYGGILTLLGGDDQKDLVNKIYNHPLFLGKAPGTKEYAPSYIPANSFALALMESLKDGKQIGLLDNLGEVVKKMDPENSLRKALLPLMETAQGDLEKTLKNIEKWYGEAQERIIGWYKRKSKKFIFLLALVLCVLLNADTFKIAQAFYSDQTLRAGVVAAVDKQTAQPIPTDDPKAREKWEQDIIKTSKQLKLPLGWCDESSRLPQFLQSLCSKPPTPAATVQTAAPPSDIDTAPWLLFKVIGILFTAGAVSLGAPFWFDLMNKVVNLRNAGKRPGGGARAS